MPKIPCPTKIDQCLPCNDDPIENFSSEAPDQRVFLENVYSPIPVQGGPIRIFQSPGCIGICQSVVSQEDADLCALEQALLCVVKRDHQPTSLFYNKAELCTVYCPDGSTFSWSVPARMVSSLWQADANARALALACKQARARRVCINDLPDGCVGESYSSTVTAKGAGLDEFAVWEVLDGSVPPGLVFMGGVGLGAALTGTPTAAGTYSFTVRVTLSDGTYGQREFTMLVVGITPVSLPNASVGTAYSQQLSASPGDAASQTWLLTGGGALPAGLSLSTSGLVSGTPTEGGAFSFGVRMEDSSTGIVCERDLTMGVQAIPPATLYWTLDDTVVDSVAGLALGGVPINYAAGRINDGFRFLPTLSTSVKLTTGPSASAPYIFGNDLSYAFWVKWDIAPSLFFDNLNIHFEMDGVGVASIFISNQGTPGMLELQIIFLGDVSSSVSVDFPLVLGDWNFFAVVYDAGTGLATLWRNGVLVGTLPTPVVMPGWPTCEIMYEQTGPAGSAADFVLDEAGWWIGTALTAAQVSELYNAGAGQRPPNVP